MTATSDRPTSSTSQTAAPAAAAGSEQLTADPTGPIPVLPDDAARLDVEAVSTALKGKWADVRDTAREIGRASCRERVKNSVDCASLVGAQRALHERWGCSSCR